MLALALVVLAVYAGLANPQLGLGLVAATIPIQDAIQLGFGPARATPTRFVLLPFLAAWGFTWLLGRREILLTGPVVACGVTAALLATSYPVASDRAAWSQEVYRWLVAFALLVVAVDALRTFADAIPVLCGTSVAILFAGILGAWQMITHAGPPTFQVGGLTRIFGFFGEPNPMAAYLEMTVPVIGSLGIWLINRNGLRHPTTFAVGGVAAIGSATLLFTQSRGGLLGAAVAVLVVALLSGRVWRVSALGGLAVVGLLIVVTPVGRTASDRLTSSFTSFGDATETTSQTWAVQERMAHWKAGLRMLEDHPYSGVGAGNYNANFRSETPTWRFRIPRGHAHNDLIQMGAQAGYPGLIAYLAVLFSAGARIVRGVRGDATRERALAIGALGVLTAVIVHGQFDYLHGLSLNLAFVLALACAEPAAQSLFSGRALVVAHRDR
jgi:O-antigen ligase